MQNQGKYIEPLSGSKIATCLKGLQITFENGVTVSVQWGERSESSNRTSIKEAKASCQEPTPQCKTAEVAMWRGDEPGQFATTRKFIGHQTPDQVSQWMHLAQTMSVDEWENNRESLTLGAKK
tara:strand:- start:1698 stop:2066 length:369 start_codon:yes stop_codon:yes gene_type:complete